MKLSHLDHIAAIVTSANRAAEAILDEETPCAVNHLHDAANEAIELANRLEVDHHGGQAQYTFHHQPRPERSARRGPVHKV